MNVGMVKFLHKKSIFKLKPIMIGLVFLCLNLICVGAFADNYVYLVSYDGHDDTFNGINVYLFNGGNSCSITPPSSFSINGITYDFAQWRKYTYGNQSSVSSNEEFCKGWTSEGNWNPYPQQHQMDGKFYVAEYIERPNCIATISDPGSTLYDGESYTLTADVSSQQSYTRQWQRSTDGSNWQNISGATGSSYTFTCSSSSNYTYYRLLVTNNDNTTCESNVVHFSVQYKYIWLYAQIGNDFVSRGTNADAYNFTGASAESNRQKQWCRPANEELNLYLYRSTNNCNITAPQTIQHNNKTYEFIRWDKYQAENILQPAPLVCQPGTTLYNHQNFYYVAVYKEVIYCTATIYSSATTLDEGAACTLTASVTSEQNYTLQWQYKRENGQNWHNLPNVTGATYSFNLCQ